MHSCFRDLLYSDHRKEGVNSWLDKLLSDPERNGAGRRLRRRIPFKRVLEYLLRV